MRSAGERIGHGKCEHRDASESITCGRFRASRGAADAASAHRQELERIGVVTVNPLLSEHLLPVPEGDESLESVLRWAAAEYSATDAVFWSHIVQARPPQAPLHAPRPTCTRLSARTRARARAVSSVSQPPSPPPPLDAAGGGAGRGRPGSGAPSTRRPSPAACFPGPPRRPPPTRRRSARGARPPLRALARSTARGSGGRRQGLRCVCAVRR